MPNAFTPNGDGINETIRPVHSPLIREIRCDIFNRYGQRMYSYNGRGSGWDGMGILAVSRSPLAIISGRPGM